ncbi:N-acetylmuramoyl-L-alanine amidase [Bacillus safensis]|uniref:N-acetylmuramoyl-L-alanine amidase n=1 Tax=Bacillus TaxID=1386 RepID=UPI00203C91E1|nr:N-acetylmuramoyl-L-alanine amidase [Bacillus safensis]MCM3138833.1 N-acetylmuramoyl-L-alanine amidase [Bacillus safensis]
MRAFLKSTFLSIIALFIFIPSALADNAVTRIDGSTRYATAVNVAKKGWSSAQTVVLIGNSINTDVLSAIPYAYQINAPVLSTDKDKLSAETKSGLQSLKTKKVVIIGGVKIVSNSVVSQLKALGISVTRLSGNTKYDTAVEVAKKMKASSTGIIANGFVDAVAIAPYAAKMGYPILLTDNKNLQSVTANYLKSKGIKKTIVVGGELVISKTAFAKLPSPTRVGGATRYDTAVNIVKKFNIDTSNSYLSNVNAKPDAVSGTSLAAKQGKALFFVDKNNVPAASRKLIGEKKIKQFQVIGGTNVVTANVISQLKNPVVGKKVFIDPGHGAHDSGAVGYGLYEKNLNLDVAKRLNTKLNNAGALVTMSRTSDTFDSLQTRVSKGANAKADIFISVHANSNDNSSANGTETYYDKTNAAANSLKLAQNIQPKMVSALGTRDRGVKTAGFYVIKYSKMPSVLLETGFVSSPVDSNILKSATYKDRLASGISSGVSGYFR